MVLAKTPRLILLCVAILLVQVHMCYILALPVPAPLKMAILSEYAGRYIYTTEEGTIHANGSSGDNATHFFVTYPKPRYVCLESVRYPGKFLIVNELGELAVDFLEKEAASNRTRPYEWEQIFPLHPLYSLFRIPRENATDCYIAFSWEGEAVSPCDGNITESSEEAEMSYIFV